MPDVFVRSATVADTRAWARVVPILVATLLLLTRGAFVAARDPFSGQPWASLHLEGTGFREPLEGLTNRLASDARARRVYGDRPSRKRKSPCGSRPSA
jgi:hypothetical protein